MGSLVLDWFLGLIAFIVTAAVVFLLSMLLSWSWKALRWGCTTLGWLAGEEDCGD